jgi:hypothetical protein
MPVPVDSMTIGATIANKHAALRALLAVGGQVDAAQLDVGMRVTWPGKEGELVRWDAGGRIAVVCDEQGIEYRIPRFMVDVHDHENPGI